MGTKKITLAFMGDIMPGGVLEYAKCENDFASQSIIKLLNKADFRIATLESAIGENLEFDKEKMEREDWRNIIYSHKKKKRKLEQLNINLVSVANNHIFDLGEDGLRNTLTQLEKKQIKYVGANLNDFSTQYPTIIKIHNKTIAFLAYMPHWWEAPHPPSKDKPGINLFYLEKVISDVKAAKQKYDFVFVLPHWGIEYTFFPTERERLFAKLIIDAGADGIFGSHTHQIQPIIKRHGKPICFSLGNFLFPDFYIQPTRPIWYPTTKELDNIEIQNSYNYPEYTNIYLKRIWKKINRIGMIVFVTIKEDNNINTSYKLSYLDSSNKLIVLKRSWQLKLLLKIIGYALHMGSYKYIYIVIKKLHSFFNINNK